MNTLVKSIHPLKGECATPRLRLVFVVDRKPAERGEESIVLGRIDLLAKEER
jgi:hypothetical protein